MQLGDHISFEKDGVVRTVRVESVRYASGSPAVYRQLNRWQSFIRRLTPRRWRPTLMVREAQPSSITINGDGDQFGKTIAQLEQMKGGWNRILDNRT